MSPAATIHRPDGRRSRWFAAPRRRWRALAKQWRSLAFTSIRFWPFIRRRAGWLLIAFLLGLGYTAFGLLEPWFMKLILDNVLLKHELPRLLRPVLTFTEGNRLRLLDSLVALMVLNALVRGVLYFYQQLLTARLGQQVTADIRLKLFTHLQHLSFSFHERRRTGDMLTRLTTDIRILRDIFVSFPLSVTSEGSLVVGMVVVMALVDWQLTLASLIVLPALGILLHRYRGPIKQAARKQREREGHLASIAAESLGAIKVVQGFLRERYEIERFGTQNDRSRRSGLRGARLEAKFRWSAEVAVAAVTALVIGIAARRVMSGALSPGDLLVFVAYLRTFNRPLRRISGMAQRAAHGSAAGERVLGLLDTPVTVRDLPGATRAPRYQGGIRFEGVSFAHRRDGPPVLLDIDLEIRAGERVAIVGPTGAGKSSLVSLIPRFYDPIRGRVLIDARDIREFTLRSVRRQVSFVFQEPVLFAASVAENIAYGRPEATRGDVVKAAELAGIHHIIAAMPEGYDTVLGERGATISGGQRQCVAIARAIIKDAPIVILDEPVTGLDGQSARLVIDALRRLMKGRTVIMISHHLHDVRDVDRVVVLHEGRIVEEGTHAELLAQNGLYQAFDRIQTRKTTS